MRIRRPEAPAASTSPPGPSGPGRLAILILGALFVASGCSLVGSPGAVASELLRAGFRSVTDGLDPVADGLAEGVGPLIDPVAAILGRVSSPDDHLTGSEVRTSLTAHDEGRTTVRLRPRPKPGAFSMNLYRKGDLLSQQTTYWCIPASTQAMMNIIDEGKPNRTRRMQRRLYRVGDRLEEDGSRERGGEPDPWLGMGISEWAGLLNHHGYGPYEIARGRTRHDAIRKAARAMRKTGKPVGLVVWRGAHAWVMSGFVATADPAYTDDFRVTHVYVQDPWYPRVSSIWGRSRPPNSRVSLSALGEDYLRYGRPGRYDPWRNGRFLLVLPRLGPGSRVH